MLEIDSGWSLDRVFAVCLNSINNLKNAPSISDFEPGRSPSFRPFREVISILRDLQRRGALTVAQNLYADSPLRDAASQLDISEKRPGGAGSVPAIELILDGGEEDRSQVSRLKTLLGLDPSLNRFRVIAAPEAPDRRTLAVSTRSLTAALHYLGHGIEVPPRDLAAGRVNKSMPGEDFRNLDWQELMQGVFSVRSSEAPPDEANVAINYRGSWFYIADNDIDSKSTFVLLSQLMALHSPAPAAPAATLSVGGRP